MQLQIQRRAEVAIRSLQQLENQQVKNVLIALGTGSKASVNTSGRLHQLAPGGSQPNLFVYRVNSTLSIVLSFDADKCIIEDVVDRDRLDRLIANRGQA